MERRLGSRGWGPAAWLPGWLAAWLPGLSAWLAVAGAGPAPAERGEGAVGGELDRHACGPVPAARYLRLNHYIARELSGTDTVRSPMQAQVLVGQARAVVCAPYPAAADAVGGAWTPVACRPMIRGPGWLMPGTP
ncbi:hypothetical protein DC74_1583 [Streptomyces noursei]|uniref:Uncharacterized protein n=1 Tax=Streptomyces noursei TaxID=1971 RepID=A0A059VRV0_STRNR|nr:hypothetical protein DC74_1583 [Streptomyces noursei]GCB89710.1 hypothetical protein SALB_02398 [Streptomyces noursei]